MTRLWTFSTKLNDVSRTEPLALSWRVDGDSMSQDYDRDETTAYGMFIAWANEHTAGDDLLPLHWMVHQMGEGAPWQPNPRRDTDFLDYFTNPVNAATGEPINWLELDVVDGSWEPGVSTPASGFIQVATGWKPSPLQPFVSLATLMRAAEVREATRITSADD